MQIEGAPPSQNQHRPESKEAVAPSEVDREFDELERMEDLEQRAALSHILFEELSSGKYRTDRKLTDELVNGNGIRCLRLPNPQAYGSSSVITDVSRDAYAPRFWYLNSPGGRNFVGYGSAIQGYLWHFSGEESPYIQFSMSECSALYGKNDRNELLAAHVGFSSASETQAAYEYMRQNGVLPERMQAVVSLPKPDTVEWFANNQRDRLNSVEDYASLGIPATQIHPFYYQFDSHQQQKIGTHRGIVQTIAHPDFIYRYAFDHFYDPEQRRARQSDYRDQEVIDFRN